MVFNFFGAGFFARCRLGAIRMSLALALFSSAFAVIASVPWEYQWGYNAMVGGPYSTAQAACDAFIQPNILYVDSATSARCYYAPNPNYRSITIQKAYGGSCVANSSVVGSLCQCNSEYAEAAAVCVAAPPPPDGDDGLASAGNAQMCRADAGSVQAGVSFGHPIFPATGEKILGQLDFASEGPHPLSFERTYKSRWALGGLRVFPVDPGLGQAWSHNHAVSVKNDGTPGTSGSTARVLFGDGSARAFSWATSTGTWSATNSGDSLTSNATGPVYLSQKDNASWQFDLSGMLLTVTQRNGWITTYSYSTATTPASAAPVPGLLISVTNQFGKALGFAYNSAKQLVSVSTPDGRTFNYQYSAATSSGRLLSFSYPAGTNGTLTRTYVYGNTQFPLLLMGIVDEANNRLATYSYDSQGRATSTQHALGADLFTVTYGAAGTATVVDPLGTQRTFSYGTNLGKLAVTASSKPMFAGRDAAARVQDSNGFVTEETDYLGISSVYSWDALRRLPLSVTRASGRPEAQAVTTQWHASLSLPTLVSQTGRTTAFVYDNAGNRLSETVTDTATGQARTWAWTYNGQGLADTMTGPKGGAWQYGYDSAGNLTSATNPLGHATAYTYDAGGRVLTQAETTGLLSAFTYDTAGRLVSQNRGGEVTDFTYRSTGQLAGVSLPDGLTLTYSYDTAQRLTGWSSNRAAQGAYALDAMGNRTMEQIKNASGAVVWQLARSINSLNRVASETLGVSQNETFAYNANGDLTGYANGLTQSTSYGLDGLKRVTAVTNAANATAAIAYNALDGVTSATDFKGASTSYGRNAFGEAAQESSTDAGSRATSYDAMGLPTQIVDALGQATSIQRDALGRPVQMTFQDGKSTILRYDLTGSDYNAAGAPNASKGHLSEIQDRSGTTRWQRDLLGRVTQKVQTLANGAAYTTGYSYNAQGLPDILTYPAGGQLQHLYSAAGQLTGLNWNGTALVTNIGWNAMGQVTGWTWAFATPVSASRSYDTAGRVTATEIASYGYDAAGRITSLTQNLGQPADSNPASQSVTFANSTFSVTYDAVGRITGFNEGARTSSFSYDANGNRLASTQVDSGTTTARTYTVDSAGNKLLGFTQQISSPTGSVSAAVTYSYNANGDLTTDGLTQFEFDPQGRMSSMVVGNTTTSPTTRYAHNALGQRVFKTEPLYPDIAEQPGDPGFWASLAAFFASWWSPQTKTVEMLGFAYVYDEAGTLLGEYGSGGAQSTGSSQYLWLPTPNGPLPIVALVGSNKYAVHADNLNTPRRLTDDQGNAAWQWRYSGFGDEKPTKAAQRFVDPEKTPGMGSGSVGDVTFNLRYPGQYADKESGLHYNYFRSYSPNTGRYSQPDPIGLDGGWNRFAYVGGSPLSHVDPYGLDWQYNSSTGQFSHDGTPTAPGYAGNGAGLNNPNMQNVPNVGPLPQGSYTIGPQYNNPKTGPATMNLIPDAANDMYGRNAFRIHGDNGRGNSSASEGCIILPRNVRNLINASPDKRLVVTP